jgi:dynein heavy chain
VETSKETIGNIDKEVQGFHDAYKKFTYFSDMFEYPDVIDQAKKNLDMISKDTTSIKNLWDHIKVIQDQFAKWLSQRWADVNGQDMADEVKALNKQLTSLPNLDRKSNVFVGIAGEIKAWNIF